jgi:predicted nuclease of predicted toxin-antitoxin system
MMQFKIDENLPVECVQRLQAAGYAAETVAAEGLAGQPDAVVFAFCQHEQRVLVTLDRGFGDIRRYPIGSHAGIIVQRPVRQDRAMCLALVEQLLPLLREQELAGCIWIVEWGRVRVRSARGG